IQEQPDVILASLPTVELALSAVKYGQQRGVPVILDMRDMWPDIFVDHAPSVIRPGVRMLLSTFFADARPACAGATAITGITDDFLSWGLRRGGRSKSEWDRVFPLAYLTEPPRTEQLREADAFWDELKIGDEDCVTACFIGTMNHQYQLDGVLRA